MLVGIVVILASLVIVAIHFPIITFALIAIFYTRWLSHRIRGFQPAVEKDLLDLLHANEWKTYEVLQAELALNKLHVNRYSLVVMLGELERKQLIESRCINENTYMYKKKNRLPRKSRS
jgi:hypothetical protein